MISTAIPACFLRPWRFSDIERLLGIANDLDVARYMGDRFPHPYKRSDAEWWMSAQAGLEPVNNFAIDVDGKLAGGIGLDPFAGEKRLTSHIGYWLGREYWGRGIATAACAALTEYALKERGFVRLETTVYAPNVASMRVLEKCGYVREGVMRKAIFKHGEILDAYLYARIKAE
jgi:RimJ/RimL family protein N-acetyltransferase